ncbi:hypothetical protein Daura_20905 [Dactylosporangium aurantiacum]|uniref:ABC3 transporter permease protein domain-containing protein n=1 Tax=Dactylosporangium aurantiacum TaxID=35754 RepID=A0A9Q9IMJ8_9ACTN|nr:hypothetical protein [Dactylosporangium aurantiacum]MDG6110024.1 hypothetical protein [Dactylosporangium aurantiacum]UWZ58416.1 hypothetical protein Daura_20905 [Dactylosporangium aurantiacum]
MASLLAVGWSTGALGRLIANEGLGIGVAGGILGAGAGLAAASLFVGHTSADLVLVGLLAALAGTLLAGVSAALPALPLSRRPVARLLAED